MSSGMERLVKRPRRRTGKAARIVPPPRASTTIEQATNSPVIVSQMIPKPVVDLRRPPLATTDASGSSTPQLTSQSTSRESSVRTSSPHPGQTPVTLSKGLKRKVELYVDIPSPLHRTSPVTTPRITSPLVRRLSKPIVEIPLSPASRAHINNHRNGISGSPLSAKAFNLNTNTHIPTEPPSKKLRLSNSDSKDMSDALRCHQCGIKHESTNLIVCKTIIAAERSCGIRFCAKCLQRRYNESFDLSQASKASWSCPKCRDICNCSRCMRGRGFEPVGVFKKGVDAQSFVSKPLTAEKQERPATISTPSRRLQSSGTQAKAQFPVVELRSRPNATAGPSQESKDQIKVLKPKAKRAVREPKWTEQPIELSRSEVEDKIYLREFVFRFSMLMPKIQTHHLESLNDFKTFSQTTAAVIITELVDLIALETENEEEKQVLRAAHDRLTSAGSFPAAIWAILKDMQSSLNEEDKPELLHISDPSPIPAYMENEAEEAEVPAAPRTRRNARKKVLELDNGVKHAVQLMPPILSLCERALQGASIRAEVEEGYNGRKDENRAYYAEVKKENDRWAKNRKSFGVEDDDVDDITPDDNDKPKAKGKRGVQWSKIKDISAYKAALAEHRANLANIENVHLLELQGQMPRFGPLGRDSQGRIYYACSARRAKDKRSRVKALDANAREQMEKWGWFLAVWGPGGTGGSGSTKRTSYADDDDEKEKRWWGFADPAEIRQLAKWLSSMEGLDEKPALGPTRMPVTSPVKRKLNSANMSGLNLGPPTRKHLTSLVKSLNEYADLLAWRIGG